MSSFSRKLVAGTYSASKKSASLAVKYHLIFVALSDMIAKLSWRGKTFFYEKKEKNMNRRLLKSILVGVMLAVLLVSMAGCNLPTGAALAGSTPTGASAPATVPATVAAATATVAAATDTATATIQPTVTHLVKPAEPPASFESQIYDMDSSAFAAQHRVEGGDNFVADLFERPFDQSMNTYFPDLDIKQTYLSRDATWTYVTISLVGQSAQGGLPGDYGLEIDVNRDGRGEFLIMAAAPGASWSTDGVQVWQDKNGDVGGATPIQSDPPPQTGDSYETVLFNAGQGADPDLAWARVSPTNPASVQIAFKRSLFNDANPYMWGAWAMDASMLHPDWFDYNDHFTLTQAGSPLQGSADYPLKALYEVDNTCRWAVGFTPTGNEPGICPVIQPTATPIPTFTPTRTPTKVSCILIPGTKLCRPIIITRIPIIPLFPLNTATPTKVPCHTSICRIRP
jgi:hypothetical protein